MNCFIVKIIIEKCILVVMPFMLKSKILSLQEHLKNNGKLILEFIKNWKLTNFENVKNFQPTFENSKYFQYL